MNSEIILDENIDGNSGLPSKENAASTGQRFVNYLIDVLVFYAIYAVFIMIVGVENLMNPIVSFLITWSIFVAYYTIMESSTGKTVGKMVSGTIVVMEDGSKPTTSTALLRGLSRLVPFEFLSAFSESNRMWHDSWTKSWVVKKK